MNERLLGSLIIGGIATLGVAWALIEGIPPLQKSKKQEARLEESLLTIVREKCGDSIESLDVRRASFYTDYRLKENKFDVVKVFYGVVSLEGYDDKGDNFKCEFEVSNDHILDLNNKIVNNNLSAYEALRYNIYQNYSMTSPKLFSDILSDPTTKFLGFYLGDGTYGQVFADTGTRIVSIGDPNVPNGKSNRPYSVDDVLKLTSSISKEVYLYGQISEIVSEDKSEGYSKYSVWMTSNDGDNSKALLVEDLVLGTGFVSVELNKPLVITSPVIVDGGNVKLGQSESMNPKISAYYDAEKTEVKNQVIDVAKAVEISSSLDYGETTDDDYYVIGIIKSYRELFDTTGKLTGYDIKLVTEGAKEGYEYEVSNASLDLSNIDAKTEIHEGDTIVVRGKLTSEMKYNAIYEANL